MTTTEADAGLRRTALAVSVLHDLDLAPVGDGLALLGRPVVPVSWEECRRAVGDAEPEGEQARDRLARWLLARRWIADRGADGLAALARPVGLPIGHPLHPGPGWVRRHILGGALDVGLGFVGLAPGRPDDVVVVPDGALAAAGVDAGRWWPVAAHYLERMGTMAAARLAREPGAALRPMGDCDVATLLGSTALRAALVAGDPSGMRAVAAPMRRRGWVDLARIDPAFALAAAAATAPAERGFERPVLVTAEEVVLARTGGRPAEIVLRDPAPEGSWERDVLYR